MATVFIPSLMQKLTGGQQQVAVAGSSVREIINNLDEMYPGMKDRLVDKFRLKPNITVAVDGEVTPIGMLEKVAEESEVHFLPAIGGGEAAGQAGPDEVSGDVLYGHDETVGAGRFQTCPPLPGPV
jgi:molybdopterin synthase sulfur carrier subunit